MPDKTQAQQILDDLDPILSKNPNVRSASVVETEEGMEVRIPIGVPTEKSASADMYHVYEWHGGTPLASFKKISEAPKVIRECLKSEAIDREDMRVFYGPPNPPDQVRDGEEMEDAGYSYVEVDDLLAGSHKIWQP